MTRLEVADKEKLGFSVICLGIYFMAMPFDSFNFGGMGSLNRILILLPIIGILLERNTLFYVGNLTKILIVYLAYFLLTTVYSISLDITLSRVWTLLMNIMAVLCVGALRKSYSEREINFLKKSLVIGGILTIVFTLAFSGMGSSGRLTMMVNEGGQGQDQNYLNGYMMFVFVLFVARALKKSFFYICPILGIFLFILFTGSRGSLLAFSVTALFIVFYVLHNQKKSMYAMIILAVIFFILYLCIDSIMALLPPSVAVRFTADYVAANTTTGRGDIWMYLLQVYADSSVFRQLMGFGYGATSLVNQMGGNFGNLVAHNLWIEHLIMGGLFGEILFNILIICYIRAALRTGDIFIIASYIGFLVMAMSLSLISYKPIWDCMMMIIIITRYNEAVKKKKPLFTHFSL